MISLKLAVWRKISVIHDASGISMLDFSKPGGPPWLDLVAV